MVQQPATDTVQRGKKGLTDLAICGMINTKEISPMNIQVDFPAEIEQTLQQLALASGVDVATIVRTVVTEKLEEEMTTEAEQKPSHDEFARRLKSWVELHPVRESAVDDSRESIYAGRGE